MSVERGSASAAVMSRGTVSVVTVAAVRQIASQRRPGTPCVVTQSTSQYFLGNHLALPYVPYIALDTIITGCPIHSLTYHLPLKLDVPYTALTNIPSLTMVSGPIRYLENVSSTICQTLFTCCNMLLFVNMKMADLQGDDMLNLLTSNYIHLHILDVSKSTSNMLTRSNSKDTNVGKCRHACETSLLESTALSLSDHAYNSDLLSNPTQSHAAWYRWVKLQLLVYCMIQA